MTRALLSVHPYEEPAFDFYSLSNTWEQAGSGVVGELPAEEDELSFLLRIKALFNVGCVKHSPFTGKPIREVAICGGSGAFLIKELSRMVPMRYNGEGEVQRFLRCGGPDSTGGYRSL